MPADRSVQVARNPPAIIPGSRAQAVPGRALPIPGPGYSVRAFFGEGRSVARERKGPLMFATPAFAQAAGGAGAAGGLISFVPIILIFAIMYFLMIRPQQKKVKEHRAMVEALRRGDQVVTAGGMIGKVTKVEDGKAEVEVEIAPNVRVRVVRTTISQVVSKTEPAQA
jgi:preprotein translocase subunit YajC